MISPRFLSAGAKWGAIAAMVMLLSGCYIVSVHPIAQPDQQVFDPALIGTWVSGADTLKIQGDNVENLVFEVIEGPGPASENIRRGHMDLAVAHIEGVNYLDVRPGEILDSPIPILEQMLLIPMHIIIRYRISGDSLILQHIDFTKINEKNKRGRAFGLELERMAGEGPLLITSNTEKVRRFLAKYGDQDDMFEDPTVYARQ